MKTLKRISALVLAVLLLACLSISAWADEYDLVNGSITVTATSDGSSTTQTVSQGSNITQDANPTIKSSEQTGNTLTIHAEAGATANVTLGGVNIYNGSYDHGPAAVITSGAGAVVIELDGTSTVTSGQSHAGVEKGNSGTLTIKDDNETAGSLDAQGGQFAAGIGGGYKGDGSDITISGGIVTATGNGGGAGIGGGISGGTGSDITISGGTVYAAGISIGAGIGGGSGGIGSAITISGDAQVHVAGGQEKLLGDYSYGAGAAIGNGGAYSYNPTSPAGADVDPVISGLYTTGTINYYEDGTGTDAMKDGSATPFGTIHGTVDPPEPEPEPEPDPRPDPKPAAPTYYTLSFDLGGGTIDGKSEYKLSAVFGQKLELPTPVKDGATFKGWKTVINGEEVILEAGEQFTVKGAASFTAIWE